MTLQGKPFVPGPDARRHVFTPEERQLGGELGYLAAQKTCSADAGKLAWLFRRVRSNCRRRRRSQEVPLGSDAD